MKAHTEYLTFNTKQKRDLVHLTETVSEIVAKSGIQEGEELDGQRPKRVIVKALGF